MTWQLREDNGLRYYQSGLLAKFPWLRQGFSTRCQPSEQEGKATKGSQPEGEGAEEYRRQFLALFQLTPDRTQFVRQVHGDVILPVEDLPTGEVFPEADAMMTACPGIGLATIHADCVPVVLVDPVRRVIAAVHAGWKGTLAGIVPKTLRAMAAKYGSVPSDCWAAIGPAVGSCCYRVGPERVALFQTEWPELNWYEAKEKETLNLAEINEQFLLNRGVPGEQIDNARLCTACLSEEFYSFRREQTTSRMLSVVVMK